MSAPCQCTPAPPPASAHQRHGHGHAVAPLHAGDGSRIDRSCLEPERGLAVSGAAVAPASGGVITPRGGKRHREGACADGVRPHGRGRERHQGSEDHWNAVMLLSSRSFRPCDSRQAGLVYLPARWRYTTAPEPRRDWRNRAQREGTPGVRRGQGGSHGHTSMLLGLGSSGAFSASWWQVASSTVRCTNPGSRYGQTTTSSEDDGSLW